MTTFPMTPYGSGDRPEVGHESERGEPSSEDGGTGTPNVLARQLSDFARRLQSEDEVDETLEEVVRAAVALIPGADEASISVVEKRQQVSSRHPSGDLPRQVDALQAEVRQGPCLDAMYEQQTVRVPDMRHEQRWPDFARRAYDLGAAGMLSFQLYVEGDNLGALNLYSREAGGFSDESEHIGLLVASHAAVAFADAMTINQMLTGMRTRDLIGQAKGILMERFQLSADQAFRLLTRISQHNNRKLHDIAAELCETGTVPTLPARSAPDRASQQVR